MKTILIGLAAPFFLFASFVDTQLPKACVTDITEQAMIRVTRKNYPNAYLECKDGVNVINYGEN